MRREAVQKYDPHSQTLPSHYCVVNDLCGSVQASRSLLSGACKAQCKVFLACSPPTPVFSVQPGARYEDILFPCERLFRFAYAQIDAMSTWPFADRKYTV